MDKTKLLEKHILQLEAQIRSIRFASGIHSTKHTDGCTNGCTGDCPDPTGDCTYGCTNGCTNGCTDGCSSHEEDLIRFSNRVEIDAVHGTSPQLKKRER